MSRHDDLETVYLSLTTIVRRREELSGELHPELSLPAFTFLTQVDAEPGTRARDLAQHFGLDKSTVSRQVDRLEAAGLLRRRGEQPGRRGSVLEVTAEGRRMLDATGVTIRRVLAGRLAGWGDEDIAALAHLLAAFNRTMEPPLVPPAVEADSASVSASFLPQPIAQRGGTGRNPRVDRVPGDGVEQRSNLMAKRGDEVLTDQHRELQELFHRVSQPDEDRREVLKTIVLTLSAHVAMEKQVLVPALKEHVEDSGDMVSQLDEDHDEVERILTLLERRKANSPDVPDLVTELLDRTDRHVSQADGVIIPALRAALDGPALDQLGEEMESDEQQLLTHPHPLLPDSGPLAAVSRKVAGVVDKVRDHSDDIGRSGS